MLGQFITPPGWLAQFKGLPATAHAPVHPQTKETAPTKKDTMGSILDALNNALSSPQDAPLMGFGQGLLAASAPHMLTPVPMGQALGMGLQQSQRFQQQALANAMQRAVLPMKQAETATILKALAGQGAHGGLASDALVMNMLGGPGAAANLVKMNPALVQHATLAAQSATPHAVGPGQRVVTGTGAPILGAQGALPIGAAQTPNGSVQMLRGALPAMIQGAYGQAGGAAAAKTPYDILREQSKPRTLAPGTTLVNPSGVRGGAAPAIQRAIQKRAMERVTGEMMGAQNAAQAANIQSPLPQQPQQQQPQGMPAPMGSAAPSPMAAVPPSQGMQTQTPQGSPSNPQAALAAIQQRAAALSGASGNVMGQGEPLAMASAQKSLGAQTGRDIDDANEESAAARQQVAVYNQMGEALAQIGPTGAFRDLSTPLAHLANYLGLKPFNITNISEFDKYRTQMVGAATKAVSPRASTQEMNFLSKSVPDVNMPGKAAQVLVSELRGLSQYQVIKANALTYYMQHIAPTLKGPYAGTSMAFEKWWMNNGPSPSAIVLTSVMSDLTPAERVKYRKALMSNPTGKHMWRQAMRGVKFEQMAPSVFEGL